MAKLLFVLALAVVSAHCAVFKNNDASLKRVARSSCDPCDREHHEQFPPPPPPPIFPPPPHGPPPPPPGYHARQWTGYLRSADGSQQGIFSGAAASAQDTQASGQAFSLSGASSGANEQGFQGGNHAANTPIRGDIPYGAGAQSAAFSQSQTESFGTGHGSDFQSQGNAGSNAVGFGQSNLEGQRSTDVNKFGSKGASGFDSHGSGSNAHAVDSGYNGQESQANAGASAGYTGHSDLSNFGSKGAGGFESHGSGSHIHAVDSGYNGQETQANAGASAGYTEQSDLSNFGSKGAGGFESHGSGSHIHAVDSGYNGQESQANAGASAGYTGQSDLSNFGSKGAGGFESHGSGSHIHAVDSGYNGQESQADAGASAGYTGQSGSEHNSGLGQVRESGQATLQGALGLASQGLQAQQGIGSGCSTCGKTSYALSNAKSHSGNAVAVSVNG